MDMISDYIEYWQDRYDDIFKHLLDHIQISFLAIALAIIITIPIAVFMTKMKSNFLRNSIFNIANILQTIPTIAMFALMIPLLGIGFKPAVLALFLYALLPLLRNTYSGMMSIDPDTVEAAKGMGYNKFQRIFKVELPMAFPYIMSGIRITTVYIISWTTLAAVIGAGGLGDLVLSGIGLNNQQMIFTGTILAVLLAVLLDLIFGKIERKFTINA